MNPENSHIAEALAQFSMLPDFKRAAVSMIAAQDALSEKSVKCMAAAGSLETAGVHYFLMLLRMSPDYVPSAREYLARLREHRAVEARMLDRFRQAIEHAKSGRANAVSNPLAACWTVIRCGWQTTHSALTFSAWSGRLL